MGQTAFVTNNLFNNVFNHNIKQEEKATQKEKIKVKEMSFFGDHFSDESMQWDEYGNPGFKDEIH